MWSVGIFVCGVVGEGVFILFEVYFCKLFGCEK